MSNYLDLECGGTITRLRPDGMYVIQTPAAVSESAMRDLMMQLRASMDRAFPDGDCPHIMILPHDADIQDAQEYIAGCIKRAKEVPV